MTWCFPELPFVRRSRYDHIRRENAELRNALKNANEELRKSRKFIAGIRSGAVDVVGALDRIKNGASA